VRDSGHSSALASVMLSRSKTARSKTTHLMYLGVTTLFGTNMENITRFAGSGQVECCQSSANTGLEGSKSPYVLQVGMLSSTLLSCVVLSVGEGAGRLS